MPLFERYLGIDYSGAETPTKSLPGLRLYAANREQPPAEIPPPPSPRKYWTRRGLAEWLASELRSGPPTLVGIDHAFSFPLRYFEVHRLVSPPARTPVKTASLKTVEVMIPISSQRTQVTSRPRRHGESAGTGDCDSRRWEKKEEEASPGVEEVACQPPSEPGFQTTNFTRITARR